LSKRPAGDVDELVAWARNELKPAGPWRIVSSRRKLAKTLFEYEEDGRRYTGKVSKTQGAAGTYSLMKRVWDAGMKPPSPYRIVEPVAWLPERLLLIQAKAEGTSILDLVKARDPRAEESVEKAGGWLHAMQSLAVDLPPARPLTDVLQRCARELGEPRASAVLDRIAERLEAHATVPAHGDFHPLNLYVTDAAVTAIDLDTLGMREPAFDVAWFASQLAIMGHHAFGTFAATADLRRRFRECAPAVPEDRFQLHLRFAILRSLHYDFCILRVKDRDHGPAFLEAAENGLDT
jgi:hypothetical protein